MELVTNKSGPTVFQTALLGDDVYDEEENKKFVSRNQ